MLQSHRQQVPVAYTTSVLSSPCLLCGVCASDEVCGASNGASNKFVGGASDKCVGGVSNKNKCVGGASAHTLTLLPTYSLFCPHTHSSYCLPSLLDGWGADVVATTSICSHHIHPSHPLQPHPSAATMLHSPDLGAGGI